MALFSSGEETAKIRLNEYSIIQYVHKKDSTAREIISYYETVNNNAYQHYASEWRHIDLDMSDKEYKQFLYISLGSCSELSTQIIIASRLSYFNSEEANKLLNEIDEICKMTMSLIKKLNTKY